jgi:hypothetical protein
MLHNARAYLRHVARAAQVAGDDQLCNALEEIAAAVFTVVQQTRGPVASPDNLITFPRRDP